MRFHLFAICALTLLLGFSTTSQVQAHELDKEIPISTEQAAFAKNLPRTVVVRVKAGTQEAEVLQSKQLLSADKATIKKIAGAKFQKLAKNGQSGKHELDQDSSTSSWYFWCNPYGGGYYPNYYYYGYTYSYTTTYNYYYGGYYYSYYGWPYWH